MRRLSIIDQAKFAAINSAKPRVRSRLPNEVDLTRWLREINKHYDGPGPVYLVCDHHQTTGQQWRLMLDPGSLPHPDYSEEIPGDGRPFRAVGVARRLLSEARLAGFR